MPAPRAVLIDIHDRGLNPKVAHKSTDSSGRIKGAPTPTVDPQPEVVEPKKKSVVKPAKKAEPKDELKQDEITTVASNETSVEVKTNEGAGSVEHKQQEEVVTETPATPRTRGKRTPNDT